MVYYTTHRNKDFYSTDVSSHDYENDVINTCGDLKIVTNISKLTRISEPVNKFHNCYFSANLMTST